jgi:hypothetical protein
MCVFREAGVYISRSSHTEAMILPTRLSETQDLVPISCQGLHFYGNMLVTEISSI